MLTTTELLPPEDTLDAVAALAAMRSAAERRRNSTRAMTLASAQLPLWPDNIRGLPNPLARSALFTVGNRNQARLMFKNKLIASVSGVKITYRGEELRQDDEDVFLQILHLSRGYPLGEAVEFTGHGILSELGWGRSSKAYSRVRECLARLSATSLTVATDNDDKGFSGSLIRKFAWQGEDGSSLKTWKVWLEPELTYLFAENMYTQIFWEQRLSLSSTLARWLHGYYYTHGKPYPHKSATLRTLCGSRSASLSDFRRQLISAHDALVACKFLADYDYDNKTDLMRVMRREQPKIRRAD